MKQVDLIISATRQVGAAETIYMLSQRNFRKMSQAVKSKTSHHMQQNPGDTRSSPPNSHEGWKTCCMRTDPVKWHFDYAHS